MAFVSTAQILCFILFHFYFQSLSSNITTNYPLSKPICPLDQSHALLQFKTSLYIRFTAAALIRNLSINPYPKTDSWTEGTDCCLWDGVTCDLDTGFVIGLDLPKSMLYGNFYPNNSLFTLLHLQKLDLSFNYFIGSIPSEFGNLIRLTHLNLKNSNFEGRIPLEMGHLFNLISLDLSWNNGSVVEETSHAFNKLVGNLTKLQELDLSSLNLSSVSPNSFVNLSSSLSILRLRRCELGGNFPSSIIQLPNLQDLDLSSNYLTGHIPSNVGNNLERLDLSNNQLSGHIPSNVGNNLERLDLSNNQLSGHISSNVGNLSNLDLLYLTNNQFSGHIPSNVGNLSNLGVLDLSNNQFTGHIPPNVGNLSNLRTLDLSNNQFTGNIPNVGRLSKLWDLNLQKNQLSGQIPSDIGRLSSLSYLDLSHNKLNGLTRGPIFKPVSLSVLILSSNDKLIGKIPYEVCELKSLEILDLSNNSFSGPIPQCLGNLSIKLSVLHLGMNKFNGVISNNFARGCSVRYLNFNKNVLQGKIPPSISNCKDLEILDLSNNEIDDIFPSFLQTLKGLQILQLRWNKLHGFVEGCNSSSNYSFSKLRIFDLSNNLFSGPLPVEYFNKFKAMTNRDQYMTYMSSNTYHYDYSVSLTWKGLQIDFEKIQTFLTTIDLSGNSFKGKIPKSIGMFKSLKQLILSHNHLIGHIEPTLGNLANLETLDLSSNDFNGVIPMELTNLTSLAIFNVSYNQLEGPIPLGKQFNTFENSSYVGNEGLCGFPLTKPCNIDERQQVLTPTRDRDFESNENGFGWKSVSIGYAFGAVLGVLIGYVVFKTRKPAWLVKLIEGEGRQRPRRSNCNHRLSSRRRRRRN